jgi:hypothetical protein
MIRFKNGVHFHIRSRGVVKVVGGGGGSETQGLAEECRLACLGPLHTRDLRAREHYTSSTPIGGKGGAGPSSLLHTTKLEGPTE